MCDTPFNVLLEQAVALKTSQASINRRKYDKHHSWYQHSLYAIEDVLKIRATKSFQKIYEFAKSCKEKGNCYYQTKDYHSAIYEYERSLSVFDWIEPIDCDWKNKEIQDDCLREGKYLPCSMEEESLIRDIKISNLLNLSISYLQIGNYKDCINACDTVLFHQPNHVKALYRRAQARITPLSSGTIEHGMALKDLKAAYQLSPKDSLLKNSYFELKTTLSRQKSKDKKLFNNLFERQLPDEIISNMLIMKSAYSSTNISINTNVNTNINTNININNTVNEDNMKSLTWKDAFVALKDMESAFKRYSEDGEKVKALLLKQKINGLKQQINLYWPGGLEYVEMFDNTTNTINNSTISNNNHDSISNNTTTYNNVYNNNNINDQPSTKIINVNHKSGILHHYSKHTYKDKDEDDLIEESIQELLQHKHKKTNKKHNNIIDNDNNNQYNNYNEDFDRNNMKSIIKEVNNLIRRDCKNKSNTNIFDTNNYSNNNNHSIDYYIDKVLQQRKYKEAQEVAKLLIYDLSRLVLKDMLVFRIDKQYVNKNDKDNFIKYMHDNINNNNAMGNNTIDNNINDLNNNINVNDNDNQLINFLLIKGYNIKTLKKQLDNYNKDQLLEYLQIYLSYDLFNLKYHIMDDDDNNENNSNEKLIEMLHLKYNFQCNNTTSSLVALLKNEVINKILIWIHANKIILSGLICIIILCFLNIHSLHLLLI